MEKEIWKDIPNYEGIYQVSSLGNVKRYYKNGKYKDLVLSPNNHGYLRVRLSKNGIGKTKMIHKLVAITFFNHKPCGYKETVDHINCIKTDNRLENLQLISSRLNSTKDRLSNSGYNNIYKNIKTYRVRFKINGKMKQFGTFKKIEDAIIQRDKIFKLLEI